MNQIKGFFIFTIILSISFCAKAQKGFDIIRKAEKSYENKNYSKTLKLLLNAENRDYGFCGNAWIEANHEINKLRAEVYINQGEYQLARSSLDSILYEFIGDNLDSIKIRTYQMEFGKESLIKIIDSSLLRVSIIESEIGDFYIIIPLLGLESKEIKLKVYPMKIFEVIVMHEESKRNIMWLESFRKTSNYRLIKGID